ncbi:MAG TPA: hypothetical protein VKM55_12715 [Candidatus Lokiarchaeia archaeon]|nr:hypothetical protein [Candidatus Lokiarchaeia archaeon]
MALMERKREKKGKGTDEKPAKQVSPAPREQGPVVTASTTKHRSLEETPGAQDIPESITTKHKPRSLVEAAAAVSSQDATDTDAPSLEMMTSPPNPSDLFLITKETSFVRPSNHEDSITVSEEQATKTVDDVDTEATEKSGDALAGVEYEDLIDIEKDILRVAKDSLKKKRYEADIGFEPFTPMVDKLLNDCIAKYHSQKGYSKEAIIETIKGLVDQKWIVTAERRTKDEVLETKLYQDIIKMLEEYPGTHARDDRVQELLGITRNPFLKHVLVLERFDLIKKRKFGKLWNFFALNFNEDDTIAELVVVLYNDIVRQLIQLLLKNPDLTLMELAESVIPPVYHGAIQYHLKKLEELGLVKPDGTRRVIDTDILQRYNAVVCDTLKIQEPIL